MSAFSLFAPIPALAGLVEAIWDVDLPNPALTGLLAFKVLPAISPTLCVHYRAAADSTQRINPGNSLQRVTGIQTQLITIRPTGPVGAVIVHFRPEAGHPFLGGCSDEFTDANVCLADLLTPTTASRLDERMKAAAGPAERVMRMQEFLLQNLRPGGQDLLVRHAVLRLCRQPDLPIRQLAAGLGISQRQLTRRFRLQTGTGLKQFARVARLGTAIRARRRGHGWSRVAHEAGFSDQAHLIREFQQMTRESPQSLFPQPAVTAGHQHLNAALAMSSFFNTLVV